MKTSIAARYSQPIASRIVARMCWQRLLPLLDCGRE
jgi:hypothetical protein